MEGFYKIFFFVFLFCITASFTIPSVLAKELQTVMITEGSDIKGCEQTATCYIPSQLEAKKSTTVTWINVDEAAHTVTSGNPFDGPDGKFDSSLINADEVFSYTFDQTGSFDYFCLIHPWMEGTVIVKETFAQPPTTTQPPGGGCLIATATFGTELAPQVQLLREIRDNKVLTTTSGTSFMSAFNHFYYLFSPTIADWERQNSLFKETVKITLTPMLATLSILNYVDVDSEQEILGYGIGIILLNLGIYLVAPAILILKLVNKSKR